MNFENISEDLNSIEKDINNIKATNICKERRETKSLNQLLKTHEVLVFIKDIKAKGEKMINTFINTYLMLYEIARFKRPIETKLFMSPSNEKILSSEFSTYIVELNFSTNVDKQIFSLKTISPTSLIDNVMLENKAINCFTINKEEFIAIEHKNNLNIN